MNKRTLFIYTMIVFLMLFCSCQNNTSQNTGAQVSIVDSSSIDSNDSGSDISETSSDDAPLKVASSPSNKNNDVTVGSADEWRKMNEQLIKSEKSGSKKQIIANLNGKGITQYDLESCMLTYNYYNSNLSEKDAFDILVKNKALEQKAADMFKVSDSEVEKAAKEYYTTMSQNEATKEFITAACELYNIKESEYAEHIKPEIKQQLLTQKMNEYLQKEYSKTDKSKSFNEYLNDYKEKLYKASTIQIIKNSLK